MDLDTAKDLLHKALVKTESLKDQDAEELLTQLDLLPLAIKQATAYINRNNTTLSKYLSLLGRNTKGERGIILALSKDFQDDGRYPDSTNAVAKTWLISFQQIQRQDLLAAEYLRFMSCLNPKQIPKSVLPSSGSEIEAEDAIGTLDAYSFISRLSLTQQRTDKYFDMHRLVHLATRN